MYYQFAAYYSTKERWKMERNENFPREKGSEKGGIDEPPFSPSHKTFAFFWLGFYQGKKEKKKKRSI
jgi:hypothetical protein